MIGNLCSKIKFSFIFYPLSYKKNLYMLKCKFSLVRDHPFLYIFLINVIHINYSFALSYFFSTAQKKSPNYNTTDQPILISCFCFVFCSMDFVSSISHCCRNSGHLTSRSRSSDSSFRSRRSRLCPLHRLLLQMRATNSTLH